MKRACLSHKGADITLDVVDSHDQLPEADRRFSEAMMSWYHAQGMHTELNADDLIKKFPTFVLRLGGFTLSLQHGGEKYPVGFSLTVYNPEGVVVDDRNYLYLKEGEPVSKRWPHGAIVVDGRKQMDFVPANPEHPKFVPPQ